MNKPTKQQNNLEQRTLEYAKATIRLIKATSISHLNKNVCSQLIRSASSVGANYREARECESRKDFIHKLSISKKELNESLYWLDLFKETNPQVSVAISHLSQETIELIKIFGSSIATAKNNSK